MIKSVCVSCGQPFVSSDAPVGTEVKCPRCGTKNTVAPPEPPVVRLPKLKNPAEREPGNSPVLPVANRIIDNIEKVIVGKHNEIVLTLAAYCAGGHVLLEDVPGVAKTMLARALARSIGCAFKRIQCTPDLLPGDITGSSIFNPQDHRRSSSGPARSSRRSSWPTKSTAPRRGRSPPCSKPWRSGK